MRVGESVRTQKTRNFFGDVTSTDFNINTFKCQILSEVSGFSYSPIWEYENSETSENLENSEIVEYIVFHM